MCACEYACMYAYMFVCMHVCMYVVCMYVCIYVCVCACEYPSLICPICADLPRSGEDSPGRAVGPP